MNPNSFNDANLLHKAFVHRSFLNEHKDESESNERLEFLGDSVLSFVVSTWLYKTMPDRPEGDLTNIRSNLVNTRSLAKVASKLKLGEKLLLSKGEEDGGGRTNTSLLADTYEATIGAVFLDQGLEAAQKYIETTLLVELDNLEYDLKDPKSSLQEHVQAKKIPSPIYKVVSEVGPDHNKIFKVVVEIEGKIEGEGEGHSKREAETAAANVALAKFRQS